MHETVADSGWTPCLVRQLLILTLIFPIGLLSYGVWQDLSAEQPMARGTDFMSSAELETRHGLGVDLIGVTAGGGMIDLRVKIHDVGKARAFLEDPANLPCLIEADSGKALMGTEGWAGDVKWEEEGILFIVFANSGGLIQPGTPVIVEFGDIQIGPIVAQ
ncbi:MAG: hypothetical protein ACQEQT_08630 [Chloroflexota bacterium]